MVHELRIAAVLLFIDAGTHERSGKEDKHGGTRKSVRRTGEKTYGMNGQEHGGPPSYSLLTVRSSGQIRSDRADLARERT